MKFLGIDYGSKRVGIAVSDDDGKLAFPKTVLENTEELIANVKELCNEENVKGVVVGESLDSRGRPNKIMEEIIPFKEYLEKEINTPIYFEPEFMTSQHAEIMQKKTELLDASAAALILQRFLDRRSV